MMLSFRAKNFMATLTSNFGVQALRFFTMTLLARRLGVELFGAYNYVILLLTYGFLLVEFGLKNLGIRELAHGRGSKGFINRIFKIRLCLAVLAASGIVILTRSAFPDSNFVWPSFYLGASLFADAFLLDYVLIAEESLVSQAIGNLGQAGFLFLACFLAVKNSTDFLLLSQFFFFSHIIWVVILAVNAVPSLKNKVGGESKSSDTESRALQTALQGAPFMVATLVAGIAASIDLLLLGQFHYKDWLGNYSAALKILGIALGIINSLLASVQPRLAKQSANLRSSETKTLIDATTRFLWMFVAPAIIGCWLFGSQLVIWVFGPAYEGAGPLLKPLSLAFGFLTLSMGPLHLIFVSHKTRDLLKLVFLNFLVGVVSVGGVLWAGRPDWVAWAMVGVDGCFMLSAWKWYGSWGFIKVQDLRFLAVPLVLLTAALLVPLGAPLRFAAGVVGYVLGLVFMKVWRESWFTQVLGRTS